MCSSDLFASLSAADMKVLIAPMPEGGTAVGGIPASPDEAGPLQSLHGASHRGRVGVGRGSQVRLALWPGSPGMKADPRWLADLDS